MNKSNFIEKLGIACFIFAIGVVVGERQRGKGPFFTSWYGNDLYYGEHVKVKKTDEGNYFYNTQCQDMEIRGLDSQTEQAWVMCTWKTPQGTSYLPASLNQRSLEKK